MGFLNKYPYTDFHELNLDYILNILKTVEQTLTDFVSLNAIKYADPIQWDITRQYEKNTVVIDPLTGTAYISVAPVPIGAALTRTEYWTVVFDLESFVTKASENFANTYEAQTTITATQATPQYGWLVWGGILYVANTNITPGDAYVVDGNITRIRVEDIVGHIQNLNTTDKSNLVAAVNEVLATLISTAGDLSDLDTTDQSNLVAAINEVIATFNSAVLDIRTDMGDLTDLATTDKSSLVNAINEVLSAVGMAITTLTDITGALVDLDTTDKSNLVAAINEVVGALATAVSDIGDITGDLSDLTTTDKSNLVAAINEVMGAVGSAVRDLEAITGNLADLTTTDKTNLVAAVNEVVGSLTNAVSDMGNLAALTTTDKSSLVAAINEVNSKIAGQYVNPKDFGAMGDGVTDDYQALQDTFDYARDNNIGGVYVPAGTYITSNTLVLYTGIHLVGASSNVTFIKKITSNTVTLSIFASNYLTDIYMPGTLSPNVNAILALTSSNGRYSGVITGITFEGVYSDPTDLESQIVDIGIVSTGSLSDFVLHKCRIYRVKHAFICNTIFTSEISNNRFDECLRGFGVNGTSTSLTFNSNYALKNRDYGYYFRSVYYSNITSNACDSLNDPSMFTDRTNLATAYTFRSCRNCNVLSNGIEEAVASNGFRFLTCLGINAVGNYAGNLGSDYTGGFDVAFIYSDYYLQKSVIKNNIAIGYNANGLIFGGADASKHHNIYFEGFNYVRGNEISGNVFLTTVAGNVVDAGWGNNVVTNLNASHASDEICEHTISLTCSTPGDLTITYGVDNKHYYQRKGKFVHVFGCIDVTLTFTTATGYFVLSNMIQNGSTPMKINMYAVTGDSGMSKKISGVTLAANGAAGRFYATDGTEIQMADLISGNELHIWYYATYETPYTY